MTSFFFFHTQVQPGDLHPIGLPVVAAASKSGNRLVRRIGFRIHLRTSLP